MANNKRIRILRTDKLTPENQLTVLEDGQPFYDKETRHLYIGNGNPINDPTSNKKTESIIAENAINSKYSKEADISKAVEYKGKGSAYTKKIYDITKISDTLEEMNASNVTSITLTFNEQTPTVGPWDSYLISVDGISRRTHYRYLQGTYTFYNSNAHNYWSSPSFIKYPTEYSVSVSGHPCYAYGDDELLQSTTILTLREGGQGASNWRLQILEIAHTVAGLQITSNFTDLDNTNVRIDVDNESGIIISTYNFQKDK